MPPGSAIGQDKGRPYPKVRNAKAFTLTPVSSHQACPMVGFQGNQVGLCFLQCKRLLEKILGESLGRVLILCTTCLQFCVHPKPQSSISIAHITKNLRMMFNRNTSLEHTYLNIEPFYRTYSDGQIYVNT